MGTALNIYLIGYRGAGKSTVAPLVAESLGPGWSAVDMDEELERRAGRSISAIFQADGESVFRDLEADLLADLSGRSGLVVATGGGVIGRPSNRVRLAEGFVVWLTIEPAVVERRLHADASTRARRPNLTKAGGADEIRTLLAERTPHYRGLADLTLASDRAEPAALATAIVDVWRRRTSSAAPATPEGT